MDKGIDSYLWVDEWARVEELWDLEDAWLPGKEASVPCRMTRSVGGTFFEMYCGTGRNHHHVRARTQPSPEPLEPKRPKHSLS